MSALKSLRHTLTEAQVRQLKALAAGAGFTLTEFVTLILDEFLTRPPQITPKP